MKNNKTSINVQKTLRATALAAVLGCQIGGCASAPQNPSLDPDRICELRKGLTTRQDIVSLFGEPETAVSNSDGDARWTYMGGRPAKSKKEQSLPTLGLLFIDTNAQIETDTLVVTLHEGVLEDYSFVRSRDAHYGRRGTR